MNPTKQQPAAVPPPAPEDESQRKQRLVELEAKFRRTETALAIAQGEHERSYTELWAYMNEGQDTPKRVLAFSPDLTFH